MDQSGRQIRPRFHSEWWAASRAKERTGCGRRKQEGSALCNALCEPEPAFHTSRFTHAKGASRAQESFSIGSGRNQGKDQYPGEAAPPTSCPMLQSVWLLLSVDSWDGCICLFVAVSYKINIVFWRLHLSHTNSSCLTHSLT